MDAARKIYGALLAFLLMEGCLAVLPPIAAHFDYPVLAQLLYLPYSSLCHQIPERSFLLFNYPLAVCHRCTGVRLGLLIGLGLCPWWVRRRGAVLPGRLLVIGAAVPLGLDLFLPWVGVYENTVYTRLVTGILFGAVLAFYLLPGVLDMFRLLRARSAQ